MALCTAASVLVARKTAPTLASAKIRFFIGDRDPVAGGENLSLILALLKRDIRRKIVAKEVCDLPLPVDANAIGIPLDSLTWN